MTLLCIQNSEDTKELHKHSKDEKNFELVRASSMDGLSTVLKVKYIYKLIKKKITLYRG